VQLTIYFRFSFEGRNWRARGGGRASPHASLRVALSVTDVASGRFHLDTVDLYGARGRTAFLAVAAGELRVRPETLRKEMAEVIFAVERAHADLVDKALALAEMTDAEKVAAMELLASPDLIARVSVDLASLGVVGEGTNLVVAYLATVSRKAERPFGVVVQSSSAAGKSTVADAVASFVPEEDLVSLSALTGQALYYLGPNDLARKVLFVSEERGASRAGYALKLLLSEGRLAIASAGKDPDTGRLRTRSYGVEGPVALLMTTTAAEVDPELANRLVVLGVDEDRAQTAAVLAAQRRAATLEGLVARLQRDTTVRLHRNAQRLLEPLPVVIPGAEGLSFPDFATRHRRDHQKLLSVIASITLLHQHQRRQAATEVGGAVVRYLEASPDDVALGASLCQEVLIRGADELSPQERRLLSVMGRQKAEPSGAAASGTSFTRRELRELTGWSEYQVRAGLARLVALEYVAEQRDRPGRRHRYTLLDEWPPGPRDGSRALSEPSSRAVQPGSPGPLDDPAMVTPTGSGQRTHVGKDVVGEASQTEATR
jgi:DNA primase